ncbi:MAG: carbohydrate kinase [Pseudomonadota bacterium]
MTLLVCGEALYDIFQTGDDGAGALSFDARVGGSPFNVAIGIARLGGQASLLTGISTDALGGRLFERLKQEGVGTGYIIRSGRRTTLSLVGLDATGHPDYAFYGIGSADCAIAPDDMPDLPPDVEGLHLGSYSIAVAPVADALAGLIAANAERFVSLDPNVRPTIEPDMGVWRSRIDALRRHSDLIKVSAEDLGMLFPGQAPADIAQDWLSGGATLVIVTDGGHAVRAYRDSGVVEVRPAPIKVIDTVGAGDSFQASLLADLQARGPLSVTRGDLPDADLSAILADAARAAAVTCGRRGADLPTLADRDSVIPVA